MELRDLVGIHLLSGVDFNTDSIGKEYPIFDANVINFVLNGVTCTAVEDPSDGYRSCMAEILRTNHVVSNSFTPTFVDCELIDSVLRITDIITGKIVIEVGTDFTVDWYPRSVRHFDPCNMCINLTEE